MKKGLDIMGIAVILGLIVAVILPLTTHYLGFQGLGEDLAVTFVAVVGAAIGLFNITQKERMPLLVASIGLVVVGLGGMLAVPFIGEFLGVIASGLAALAAPAVVITSVLIFWDSIW